MKKITVDRNAVQSLLDKTGCGMVIDRIFLQESLNDELYQAENFTPSEKQYVYLIRCVREIEGISVAANGFASNTGGDRATAAS